MQLEFSIAAVTIASPNRQCDTKSSRDPQIVMALPPSTDTIIGSTKAIDGGGTSSTRAKLEDLCTPSLETKTWVVAEGVSPDGTLQHTFSGDSNSAIARTSPKKQLSFVLRRTCDVFRRTCPPCIADNRRGAASNTCSAGANVKRTGSDERSISSLDVTATRTICGF